jgi:hypothetical protein
MRRAPGLLRLAGLIANAAVIASSVALFGCGSSGQTFTTPSPVSKCAVSFDAPTSALPAGGGTAALTVKTERECQWTAQADVAWLTITAGTSGQGDGTVQFNAAANGDPVARTGGIMLNGLRAQVTQAPGNCRFDLSPSSATIPQAGGSGRVDVRPSSALCSWTAASDADWIAITSGASGQGSAPVLFNVLPASGPPRTGTLTIAGRHFSVTQADGCTYSIAPTSVALGAAGGSNVATVTAGTGCPWTAASDVDWISVTTAAGAGNGTVGFTVAPTTGPARSGTLTIAGQVVTVTESPGCTFDVSPLDLSVEASGGNRSVGVTAAAGCSWTATSNAPWITITSGVSGDGAGTITFTAAAATGPSRTGTISVAGRTVTVAQGQGCSFSISPDSQNVPASGGSGSVSVASANGCGWTARSNVSWITIRSGTSGNGNGTVGFNVVGTTGPARSGTMTIAGRTFTVNQGQGCDVSLSASSATQPAGGGSGAFDVQTSEGCGWSAASSESWLTITAGASGSGNGTVRYAAAANAGAQRSATITVGGQKFTVTQDGGCTYSISTDSQNVGSGGDTVSVEVNAPTGCSWSASSGVPWITVTSGTSGSGNGTVRLSIAPNADAQRQGSVTIAGHTFTAVQASGCTVSISPSSQAVPSSGGSGSFSVNASGSCAWSATTNVPWISIASGSSGAGPGTVQFTVAANTGGGRTGTISVAGQTFTVTQDGGCNPTVAPETIPEPAAGGSQTVNVAAAPECSWTAASNVPWIAIGAGDSGAGNGAVRLDIQANTDAPRSGTATIAGRTVTVNQDGACAFMLTPTSQSVGADGGRGSFAVSTTGGCGWTAVSNVPWVTITGGASGSGDGAVEFVVDPNTDHDARTGTITIGTVVFTINQDHPDR